MQVTTLRQGDKYETEKQARQSRGPPLGQFDRLASSRIGKPTPPFEQPSAATALLHPELPMHIREKSGLTTPPPDRAPNGANGVLTPQHSKTKFVPKQLPNTVPLKFGKDSQPDLQLLSQEEKDLCKVLRIMPKPYLALREMILRAAVNNGGTLKKKAAREMCKIDANKTSQLFEFFVHSGWIARA